MTLTKQEISKHIKETFDKGEDLPKDAVEILKKNEANQDLTLENKMSIREKQKARREHKKKEKEEFEAKTGI